MDCMAVAREMSHNDNMMVSVYMCSDAVEIGAVSLELIGNAIAEYGTYDVVYLPHRQYKYNIYKAHTHYRLTASCLGLPG